MNGSRLVRIPLDAQVGSVAQHCPITSAAVPATISENSFSTPGSGSGVTLILGNFCWKSAAPLADASTIGLVWLPHVVQRSVTSRVPALGVESVVPPAPHAASATPGSATAAPRSTVRRVRRGRVALPVSYMRLSVG